MKYAYLRVSTREQNLSRQVDWLMEKHPDIPKENIYSDKFSGSTMDRPKYLKLKSLLAKGDELYIKELDRLGRKKAEIKEELHWMGQNGVILRIDSIPTTLLELKGNEWVLDMLNNLMIEVYASIAENERSTLLRRQAEGIASAKARGQVFGAHPKTIPKSFFEDYASGEYNITELARKYKIGRPLCYKWLKQIASPQ